MYDCVIKGATVVDGSGAARYQADVAIQDGRIVEIGKVTGASRETIEADGLVLSPGFIDPHTHYDAQLLWDPFASPSNLHGVTSVIGGNCGFTLAPLAEGDADYIRRLMAMVEGMPLVALETGIEWNWSTFGEYLQRLDGRIGVNAGFLVGHCALRRSVMGPAGTGNPASPDEIARMVAVLHEAIEAGGLGFSSSQSYTHQDGDQNPVPSRYAARDEMLALATAAGEHPGTTLEFITDGCLERFSDAEVDLMIAMSLAARRPLNWNVMGVSAAKRERHEHQLSAGSRAKEAGAKIVALTMPMLGGLKMSFRDFCALHSLPGFKEILTLPVSGRIQALRDDETRRWARQRAETVSGALAGLTRWGQYEIGETFSEANRGLTGRIVEEVARERNQAPFDTLMEIVLNDDLRTDLWPVPGDDDTDSWKLRVDIWRDERALIGGSDAGAHLDRMCGARYPTEFLRRVVREMQLISLEEAIHRMTDAPARLFGLRQRGRVETGWHADLVLFDPQRIASEPIRTKNDLPGNSERLFAGAVGIERVFVNGRSIVVAGEPTGELPGVVLRSGRETETVEVPGR